MEKKRRARINSSLSELKSLLQDVIKEEGARHNKMEKADILEMTVRYLRRVQQQRCSGRPSTSSKYRLGFNECISEIGKFLKTSDNVDPDSFDVNNNNGIKTSPLKNDRTYERNCESHGLRVTAGGNPTVVSPQATSTNENAQNLICTNQTQIPYQVYNPPQQQIPQVIQTVSQPNIVSGVQLIPTTSLVSGQVAFILPANPVQTGSVVNCVVANQPHISSQSPIANQPQIANQSQIFNQQQIAKQTQSIESLSMPTSINYTSPQTFTPITLTSMASCESKSVALPTGNTSCQNRRTVINEPKTMSAGFGSKAQFLNLPLIAPKPMSDVDTRFCKSNSPEDQNVWRPW
ncbi:hypothetical protein FSP39_001663 [Pinctada imbricata]|uniref:BHLH domain-containing protein n=1 Tax=Pinctada imbricata TaxID=66713 RepID=A0AA88YMK4_PINIB|nr:hypothetical protein FSP39_001663 [Pinctada imbricata]